MQKESCWKFRKKKLNNEVIINADNAELINNKADYDLINSFALNYLRGYAYKNGNSIYDFMKEYNIGESDYGNLMDAAAKGKHVMAHRLYGHNLLYNFPISDPENIPPFLEHLLSDLFTKQGLPIIPGELIKDPAIMNVCKRLNNNWNFVNGFDILAGTVSIFKGYDKFIKAFNYDMNVDDFNSFANTIGVGGVELAIAMSTYNPFLLIGAVLHLTSGLKGMINDGAIIYFKNYQQSLTVEFSVNTLNVKAYLENYSIEHSLNEVDVEKNLPMFPYKV